MPVMLAASSIELWLDPEPLPPEVAVSILKPFDASLMQVREVSTRVNNANYDAADVLERSDPRLF
jgi:putative SOS response-associated peptidase YedK